MHIFAYRIIKLYTISTKNQNFNIHLKYHTTGKHEFMYIYINTFLVLRRRYKYVSKNGFNHTAIFFNIVLINICEVCLRIIYMC